MHFFKSGQKFVIAFTVFLLGSALNSSAFAVSKPESKNVAEARELIDIDYGDGSVQKAIPLLERAFKTDPNDANLLVQAARVAVKDGHLSFEKFRNNPWQNYADFLDKALAIDPANAKAHILKAQVFESQGNYAEQLNELNKAKASGTDDPWLLHGYGTYYLNVRSFNDAISYFEMIEARGPGKTASDRKAYVVALYDASKFKLKNEPLLERTRKYAALALQNRYPTDAWTPQGYAAAFIAQQAFDDAIVYSKAALKTMNFGLGRLTLAVALYGKAAQLTLAQGPEQEIKPLLDEANALGFRKADVFGYMNACSGCRSHFSEIGPTLEKIIPN
ncbi:hypothetical protein SAMN05216350_101236 [Polaromonas sp. YR568]|uniref:tetratricopeptide repeat protein n=1 Tax=Polaromonas sp. YR568 TaxID=1855301 RepID=UPI0008EFDB21|nr:hypothetical protein [Polaromonas sp. YR568]SFU30822.1 hypothetical protein SAMN05216350_101236 [Polaromonas sp. YR568]